MKARGKTNEEQIKHIEEVIKHGQTLDVSKLRHFLLNGADVPLYCVGSGGGALSIKYCALLYSANKGMAQAVTPLLMNHVSDATLKKSKVLIYSKGGGPHDTPWIRKRMTKLNPHGMFGVGAFTPNAPHANDMIHRIRKVTENWCMFNLNIPKETFVSLVTPLTFATAIYRTFTGDDNPLSRLKLNPEHNYIYQNRDGSNHSLPALKDIKTFIALYGGWGAPVAAAFESIMVESGLANVQLCDIRNWCHGRFIFLANHIEDSALLFYVTPREKEYIQRLLNAKEFRGAQKNIFPANVHVIYVETEFDEPLATLDLATKNCIFLNEIANSYGVDITNPKPKVTIHKSVPRPLAMTEQEQFGAVNLSFGRSGSLKGISRKKVIVYNPHLSIEELAKKNKVSRAQVQAYIRDNHIDRQYDNQFLLYVKIKGLRSKNPDISVYSISKKLKCSYNTVKRYMDMEKFDVLIRDGHVSMLSENDKKKLDNINNVEKNREENYFNN